METLIAKRKQRFFVKIAQKRRKIAAKNCQKYAVSNFSLALPAIGHCGRKFSIGAQLLLFRYRTISKVCTKVQAL